MLDLIKVSQDDYVILDYGGQGAEACLRPERLLLDELSAVEYLTERGISDQDIYRLLRVVQEPTEVNYTP